MPLIHPLWMAAIRRHWPVVGAVAVFVGFTLAHEVLFQPAVRRYERAVKQASELGMPLDPGRAQPLMPPRVLAVVADNAVPEGDALEMANTGALTAGLLEHLSRLTSERGIEVVATEPGATTTQPNWIQVRAYLKLRARYGELVSLLDAIARERMLIAIDRFQFTSQPSGMQDLDLWVSRLVLKQSRKPK